MGVGSTESWRIPNSSELPLNFALWRSSPPSLHRCCQNSLLCSIQSSGSAQPGCRRPPKGISANWMLRFHFCSLVTVWAAVSDRKVLTSCSYWNFKKLFILRLDGILLFLLTLIDSKSLSNRNCGGRGVELL